MSRVALRRWPTWHLSPKKQSGFPPPTWVILYLYANELYLDKIQQLLLLTWLVPGIVGVWADVGAMPALAVPYATCLPARLGIIILLHPSQLMLALLSLSVLGLSLDPLTSSPHCCSVISCTTWLKNLSKSLSLPSFCVCLRCLCREKGMFELVLYLKYSNVIYGFSKQLHFFL